MNTQIRLTLAAACLGTVMGIAAAQAQPTPPPGYGMGQQPTPELQRQMWENMQRGGYGPGMGPGMMGGYGPGMGPGMMGGYGPGMGPGMMGGYGPGYGMGPGMMGMAGYGPGMGPGMMGGYGPGMGPGMMGGYGPGYGMGPGMMGMGGYGPGMGPGMMGGWQGLNLNDSQLAQWDKIHDKLQEKHRKLMYEMWGEQAKLSKLYNADKLDSAAIGKSHEKLAKLQREAIEARIEAENQFSEILTKEQKAQVRRGYGGGMMGY